MSPGPQVMGRLLINDFTHVRGSELRDEMLDLYNNKSTRDPDLDDDLWWLVARCLAINPDNHPYLSQLLALLHGYIYLKTEEAYFLKPEGSDSYIKNLIKQCIFDARVTMTTGGAADDPMVLS
ncbi:hypothetical protein F5Y19DRAFT_483356 [Xylariaceae sp. FL1651]|nr:hypothetical protein F5Y19DRAFT_483356 [Xylariaceae sp. FL1651]